MARMMDSLILNEFPPYTFTKITTTHRPTRTNNGMNASKLLAKSTANIPTAASNINNNNNNASVASVLGINGGTRQSTKSKVPMQGKSCFISNGFLSKLFMLYLHSNLITNPMKFTVSTTHYENKHALCSQKLWSISF